MQHFLKLTDFTSQQLSHLLTAAGLLKHELKTRGSNYPSLAHKTMVMIFEKASTRTRLSFEIGMQQLGGNAVFLSSQSSQLGRGEPVSDTARVVSLMADVAMIRTHDHQRLEEFCHYSTIPVINGLSDLFHPCQLLADMLTIKECLGEIEGLKVAWIGDANNVCSSYINAAKCFNFELAIYSPEGYQPSPEMLAVKQVTLYSTKQQAAAQADVITTDVWSSMGQEKETERLEAFKDCQVDEELMKVAQKNAIFLHCLPAHRGEEVSLEVLEGKQSRVWQQAENRLHAQKALLESLLVV